MQERIVQGDGIRLLAGVAGATAGFLVGTTVTSVGGGPILGVVAGATSTIMVEMFVERRMEWLCRNPESF